MQLPQPGKRVNDAVMGKRGHSISPERGDKKMPMPQQHDTGKPAGRETRGESHNQQASCKQRTERAC